MTRYTIKSRGVGAGRYVSGLSRKRTNGIVLSDEPRLIFPTQTEAEAKARDIEERHAARRLTLRGTRRVFREHLIVTPIH